jgi:ribosome maturation protein SDO1
VKVVIKIPAKYAGKAFNKLASFDMQNVKWNEDGSLSAEIRLPAGMEPEFYNLVNSITRGEGVIAKK